GFQALSIGGTGMLTPEDIQIPISFSPLNARFVAGLYLAGAVGVFLTLFVRRLADGRIFVIGFGLRTTLILGVTLLHLPELTAEGQRFRETWLVTYVVDPLLALVVVPLAMRRVGWIPGPARHRLTPLFTVEAIVFGLLGLLLLVVPGPAAAAWP